MINQEDQEKVPKRGIVKGRSTLSWAYGAAGTGRERHLWEVVDKIKDEASLNGDIATYKEPLNIVVMDGGGMKGFALLAMLEELLKIADGKDFICKCRSLLVK